MKKNKTKEQYIIFDIDSESIAMSVIDRTITTGKKHALKTVRTAIHGEAALDFDTFFVRSLRIFESLLEEAVRHIKTDTYQVYLNFSAPWVSSQKRVAHYEKTTDFIFTEELARELMQKEVDTSLKQNMDFHHFDDMKIIERRTLDIYGNGYSMRNPYGKSVATIDIHSLQSVMANKPLDAFIDIVMRHTHQEPKIFSNMFMTYYSLKKILPYDDNVITLDVGGMVTELMVLKNDHLEHIATIPVGTDTVVGMLAEKLSLSRSKARSIMNMFNQDLLAGDHKKEISSAMDEAFALWRDAFYVVMEDLSKHGLLPHVVALSAHPLVQSWFEYELMASKELVVHMHADARIQMVNIERAYKQPEHEIIDLQDQNLLMIDTFVEEVYIQYESKKENS